MWFWAWDYIINVGLVFLTIGSYKVLAVGGGCCRSGPLLFSIFWFVFFFFFLDFFCCQIMMRRLKMQLIMKILMSSMRVQRFKLLVRRTICYPKRSTSLLKFLLLRWSLRQCLMMKIMMRNLNKNRRWWITIWKFKLPL